MSVDLLFETSRFNLSQVGDHFINDCCFGEDLAAWLRGQLLGRGVLASEPDQEDWGWYLDATHQGESYFIGVGGIGGESAADPNRGEWRIMLERHRSIWQKLRGANPMTTADPFARLVHEILSAEGDFANVHFET
jgi:hypothetical protein